MNYKYLQTNISSRIGTITIDRAEKRNALNDEVVTELKHAFDTFIASKEVKVIILAANGKVFSAGADLGYLKQLQANSYDENLADSTHLMELFKQIYYCPKVVIAQIQGHAIAGGCGLATVCDFSFAAPHAKFGYTEVKIGFIPAIVMVFLIRKIGEGKAKALLLSGELIDAEMAAELGLINDIIEEDLEQSVRDFAANLVENCSEEALKMTKQMIADVQDKNWNDGLQFAAECNASARATEDCKKGIGAFINKTPIQW